MLRLVLSMMCFCLLIALPAFSQTYNVTFRVDMSTQTGFTTPEVNGTFNNWCGNCFQMTDANGDHIWEATTALAAGTYEYKFSADNWATQETLIAGSACTVTNSGFTNRALTVAHDTTLAVVCWASCVSCAATPATHQITFQVDMNGTTGFTTPEVNGTFNNWCGNCTAMSDANGDNVWEVTVTLQDGSYEYKFSADNWTTQETLTAGTPCTNTTGTFTNRKLTVTANDTLPAVCWGSCDPCGQSTGPYNITFQVDMTGVTGYTTPELNGTFNNWCGNCAQMSDANGDHIWTITIPLNTGEYDYKFSYDNWAGQETLSSTASCVSDNNGFVNRHISVTQVADLGPVCWGSCAPCIVSVNETAETPLSVFPVPFNDQLQVSNPWNTRVQMQLFDMTGRAVAKVAAGPLSNGVIPTAQLPTGTYILQVVGGNKLATRKVVKE
jgi:1,4-alpha-glucan branching enzyme